MLNPKLLLKLILLTGIITLQINYTTGQEASTESNNQPEKVYSINWVSQFPRESKKDKENNNWASNFFPKQTAKKNWLSNLIFGKKQSALVRPITILAISPDSLWICDQGNGKIIKAFNGVGEITQFKNNKHIRFPSIVGSCFLPGHDILFTDSKLNKVFRFTPGNNILQVLNDTLMLDKPTGIAYSAVNKEIWVVETGAHRIAVFNEKGGLIKYIGHRGKGPGEFNFPTFIWIDKLGIIYVCDTLNFRIQVFDKTGKLLSVFGEAGDALGDFARPKGIATDSYGNIYIADALFHNIQVFDKAGRLLSVFGSHGRDNEEFWMPVGLYIDNNDFIYVADSYNSRIQVFQLVVTE